MYTKVSGGSLRGCMCSMLLSCIRGMRIMMQRWGGEMNAAIGDHGFKHLLKGLKILEKKFG